MFKLSDRVKQTSSTTGTSNLVLDGSLSGFIIIVKEHIKAAPETIKGKFFGPNGSAKKGDSNCVALTKNVSANKLSIEPNIRSDTISLHQVL